MRYLLFVLFLTPLLATAEDSWPEGSAMDVGTKAQQRLARADKALNAAYQQIIKKLPADQPDDYPKRALIAAQRAWIKYRDEECALVGETSGGVRMWKSAYDVSCRADMTENRTKELNKLFEGDGQ
jgi:uncharacterized protein YecT (DUF1311 family)